VARLVPDWLRQRAALTPDRHALLGRDTFAELDRRVDAACSRLIDLGVQPGQRIGLRSANSPAFVVAVHALMRLGAILVPINTRLTPAEVEWQRADAELSLLLEHPEDLLASTSAARHDRDVDLDAPHSIVYTSGTTGRPKGAILTYDNHYSNALASMLNLGVLASDVWLACLPLFHVGGLAILLRSVIYGMPVLLHERFDPGLVNHAIDHQGVTVISVVSTMLERMLAERDDQPFPPTLRCVLLGGGPASLPLLQRALALGAPAVQTYGLTETASQVATLAPSDIVRKVGSAGKPLFGTSVRIAGDDEILVRGPIVSPGYLHQPPHSDWLHTGDLGYLDDEGYLYVLDRREDLIVTGGENVYPAEVESVVLMHPAVADAAVFAVPNIEWGHTVAAAVVLRHPATPDELQMFARQHIAAYKVPKRIEVVQALPRNASGKLLRRHLREQFEARA
jgi:o-succinylbenzoate---CoA ligase